MLKIFYILIILFFSISSSAQNYFSGRIDRDTRWIGDIYIDGDVVIPRGVILSIESGSRVLFKPHTDSQKSGKDKERAEIIIDGVLLVRGAGSQSPVIFTSEAVKPQMNDWYGIIVKDFTDKSALRNCIVEFGYKGVTCYGSAPTITDSEIRYNYNSGISCEVRANPSVDNSVIVGNGFAGINCELASTPRISSCTITQNTYGVIIFSRSEPDLGHYPAREGQSSGENRIYNNFDFDVYNHSTNNISAQNNFWNTTNPNEIRFTIFDNLKNPAYGNVMFQPIFFKKKSRQLAIPPIAMEEQEHETPVRYPSPGTKNDTLPIESIEGTPGFTEKLTGADSLNASTAPTTRTSPETFVRAKPETVYVYKEAASPPTPKQPEIQEPLLEAFLDSGKREYRNKVTPQYPDIYVKTGLEGDVLIQVIVGKDGNVASYQVLRSDDDLFTQAALRALSEFKYKPGTYQGKPIQYKIVERFRFKRSTP
jgi:TonB family protein